MGGSADLVDDGGEDEGDPRGAVLGEVQSCHALDVDVPVHEVAHHQVRLPVVLRPPLRIPPVLVELFSSRIISVVVVSLCAWWTPNEAAPGGRQSE